MRYLNLKKGGYLGSPGDIFGVQQAEDIRCREEVDSRISTIYRFQWFAPGEGLSCETVDNPLESCETIS